MTGIKAEGPPNHNMATLLVSILVVSSTKVKSDKKDYRDQEDQEGPIETNRTKRDPSPSQLSTSLAIWTGLALY